MAYAARTLGLLAAAVVAAVAFAAWIGLGVHRQVAPAMVVFSAVLMVFGPPALSVAASAPKYRIPVMIGGALVWSAILFLLLPVYFPGERRQAIATGLGVLGGDALSSAVLGSLPEEQRVATPEVAEAARVEAALALPTTPLTDDQIALPYEGEGRRMSVPVTFGQDGGEQELEMMFDTGATYTTLSNEALRRLGIVPRDGDPVIQLHTANGEREATVVLVDHVWLGDLRLDGVAIAACDECASSDVAGLLGLNVSGRFNVGIDADRREVLFTRRSNVDRKLDIKPFTHLSATFTRFPGGRVEVTVALENQSRRAISQAVAAVSCGEQQWLVDLGAIDPDSRGAARRKLPEHEACDGYEISMSSATW
jgi:clan AA aspartic protease (TIGR02281 family)